jgi:hypothetical protein
MNAFREYLKRPADAEMTPPIVAQKFAAEWMQFRAVQHANYIGHFRDMLHSIELEFELYSASSGKELIEGLDWTLLPGKVDYLWAGNPGGSPGPGYSGLVEEGDRIMKMFPGKRVTGQLVYSLPFTQKDRQFPRLRKNDILRTVTALRGGVNEWVNIGELMEINGVDCFAREAVDVIVKYEDYIAEGARAADEFTVTGLDAKNDHMAFRLGADRPVVLFLWNDSRHAKDAQVTWKDAGESASYTDGESGAALGKGPVLKLNMPPHSTKVIECKP